MITDYTVVGMTCQHCVRSVTEEVDRVADVQSVAVDLDTGVLSVTSDVPVDSDAIRAAVVEAGYQLATS